MAAKQIRRALRFKWWRLSLPTTLFILFLAVYIFRPMMYTINLAWVHKVELGIIFITGAWVANRTINIIITYYVNKKAFDKENNLKERSLYTRMRYIKIVINLIVFLVAVAMALRQFQAMRDLSTGLLASAGVIGIIIAFGAQKLFANVFAGMEIAFAQPIRIDDAVIVEDEWGWIEEINTTNIVVRIWDQRRLVLPITYFVEKPFQNWTKTTAEILGTAFFYVDYFMPVDEMRKELDRILKKSTYWNGRVQNVQVVETTEQTIKIRCLMSGKDSPTTWDLRCEVREKMIQFLQKKYPQYLPRMRAEISELPKQRTSKKKKVLSS